MIASPPTVHEAVNEYDASERRSILGAAVFIVFLTFAAYFNSLQGEFIYDDRASVVSNPSIQRLWPLGPVLSPPADATTGGRPFANLTFALTFALSGLAPWGHHVANVGLHALAALALFGVVRRTLRQPALRGAFGPHAFGLAAMVAALWAVHPLATQVVAYVSQRTESLMALFYLLTLYAFIRSGERRSRGWLFISVAACLLGVLSKEVIATAPVLVLLYDRTFVAGTFSAALRTRWRYYLALAATWLLLGWLLLDVRQRGVGFTSAPTWIEYPLTQCKAVLLYLKLSVWPHPLVFDYGPERIAGFSAAAPYAAILATLLAVTVWALSRRPALGFAATAFFLVLAPTSSVVPIIFQPIAENRAYLPLAAILSLFVLGLHRLVGLRVLYFIGGPFVVLLFFLTYQRNQIYRTESSVWSDTLAKRPENPRAYYNLAVTHDTARRYAESIPLYETSLRLDPRQPHAHNNLGIALLQTGRAADAVRQFEQSVAQLPDYADAHNNLAVSLSHVGRLAEAIAHAEIAVRIKPDYADARRNLGVLRSMHGKASSPQ